MRARRQEACAEMRTQLCSQTPPTGNTQHPTSGEGTAGEPSTRPSPWGHEEVQIVDAQFGWITGSLRPGEEYCPGLSPGRVHVEDTAKDPANTRGDTEEGLPGRGVGMAIRAVWASPGALQAG